MMPRIYRLCKKASDPPSETKGEWTQVLCVICGVALRATVKATVEAKILGVELFPLCKDCASLGPEAVEERFKELEERH
jgi:hypothetical protein